MQSIHRQPPGYCLRRYGDGARTLIFFILMVISFAIYAQNIIQAEYFYDTDPGYGAGIPVGFTPAPNLENLNFNPDLTSLNAGFHILYFRAKDANQYWSLPAMRPFFKESGASIAPLMTKAEYFFDTDPGYGNGTQVSVNPPANIVNLLIPLDLNGLSPGMHKLYLRSLNDNGNWSLVAVTPVLKENLASSPGNIIRVEYFIDYDPGIGLAIPVPVVPGPNLSDLVFQPDLSGITPGFHQLAVRVQDVNLKWSILALRPFFKEQSPLSLPDITMMEYFFDTDPGAGNGTILPTSPSGNINNQIIPLNMAGLAPGFHKFHLRGKDSQQRWGLTAVRAFLKETIPQVAGNIDRIEYFIDTDPGEGQAIAVSFTTGINISNLIFLPDLNVVSPGFHRLYLRARSQGNSWSHIATRPFFKEAQTTPLPVIAGMEYFFDTDPGPGNGYPVITGSGGSNANLVFPVDLSCVSNGLHRLYTRVRDDNGKWSITGSDTLTVNKSAPQIIVNGAATFCQGDSVMLTVLSAPGQSWQWYRNGQLLVGATNPVYFAGISGSYKVLINHSGFCTDSTDSVLINVLTAPVPFLTGPINLCADQPVATYYTNSTGSDYSWSISPGGSLLSGGGSDDSVMVVGWGGTSAGWVSVIYTGPNGCRAIDPVTFTTTVHPNPQPQISGLDTLCIASSGTWQTQAGNQAYSWQISEGGTILQNMDHEITSSWNTTGNHWISVNYTDNHGCTSLQPTIFPVQVVPSPSPVITGPASSCTSSPSVTYQTEPGHENYFWIVTSGGQILSGGTPSDHFVTIKWNQAGSQEVSVNYEQYGCFGANAGLMQVLVFMPPSPVIYGNSNQLGCQGTISTYSTQSGMSGYLWMVSPGGSIVSGGTPGSSAIGIQWNSTGPQWLSVNYSNTQGCSAAQPFIANLNVIPRPVPSITGPANPGTGVPCQYATEPGMTNYTWTVSPGGVISGSTNSNMITVSWTATGSGYVKVNYFNAAYCNAITPSSLQINVIPASIALQNVNIAIGQNRCYEASQIITIAGGGTSFHVETGGNATMVAGQKVVYKTGTKVFPGGYMHGYISQDGLYCQALPAMVAKDDETPETHPTVSDSPVARFKVFPNPAVEEITILPSGSIQEGISMVEIIDIHGHELLSVFPRGKTQLTLNLPDLPPGIYLLRIRSAAYCEIIKLVIRNT